MIARIRARAAAQRVVSVTQHYIVLYNTHRCAVRVGLRDRGNNLTYNNLLCVYVVLCEFAFDVVPRACAAYIRSVNGEGLCLLVFCMRRLDGSQATKIITCHIHIYRDRLMRRTSEHSVCIYGSAAVLGNYDVYKYIRQTLFRRMSNISHPKTNENISLKP